MKYPECKRGALGDTGDAVFEINSEHVVVLVKGLRGYKCDKCHQDFLDTELHKDLTTATDAMIQIWDRHQRIDQDEDDEVLFDDPFDDDQDDDPFTLDLEEALSTSVTEDADDESTSAPNKMRGVFGVCSNSECGKTNRVSRIDLIRGDRRPKCRWCGHPLDFDALPPTDPRAKH